METTTMKNRLIKLLQIAVDECYQHDLFLIQQKGTEQACVARIFYYLQSEINTNDEFTEFKGLNLDSEYNKHKDISKKVMPEYPNGIRPDILLHKRGSDDFNLLAAEFKTWDNSNYKNDINKLKVLTDQMGEYNYKLGVFVKLGKTKSQMKKTIIINGKQSDEE
jgi:hypothetical protein